ncbi:MAG: hypothetical protein HUJ58_06505 [Erysipelotrichaceae bacterium]|nr:hypothetical protein [Erysipelotrichaceae bacterium]
MMGRYGNDQLNQFLSYFALALVIANVFLRNFYVNIAFWAIWGYMIFRMMSRNIYKRYNENVWFMNKTQPLRKRFNLFVKKLKDKNNRYFRCPNCKQTVRVPKGRGKITIHCPKCGTSFDKKS